MEKIRGLLVLIAISLALIIGLVFTTPSHSMELTNEKIESVIISFYLIDVVKSDNVGDVYVDAQYWNLLPQKNKDFISYIYAVKMLREEARTPQINVYCHETKELLKAYYFDGRKTPDGEPEEDQE